MATQAWHDSWLDVDSTSDPGFFVRFLDETRGANLRMIEANAEAYYAFLGPRLGLSVLDVGTGTGMLLHGLAKLVGPEGRVVGIDASQAMIDEAGRRAPADLPLEFCVGDAYNLSFEDGTFDVAMSNVVFQHLPRPHLPLQELVRVAKPGGQVVLTEQDWDTFFIDCGDKDTTRRIVHAFTDTVPNGIIGRELPRLFSDAGLQRISAHGIPAVLTGPATHMLDRMIEDHSARCVKAGVVTEAEEKAWMDCYRSRSASGTLTIGFMLIRATGYKSDQAV